MNKTIQETLEYIEHIQASLEASYSYLYDQTRLVIDNPKLSKADKSHLEWGLAHMYNSKEEFMRDLKRHVAMLKEEQVKERNV